MLPRALPNFKKDLQTITKDFVVILSSLEFTHAHPRAFSKATALWFSVIVVYFFTYWAFSSQRIERLYITSALRNTCDG
jgi:hypothetical protein